jgi:hypothetical protein
MDESENNSKSRFGYRFLVGALTLGFIALILAIIIPRPHLVPATKSPSNECINNLRCIDEAKQEWASEMHRGTNDTPTVADLTPYLRDLKGQFPRCPSGGNYTIGKVGEPVTCSLGTTVNPAHVLQ